MNSSSNTRNKRMAIAINKRYEHNKIKSKRKL